MPPISDLWLLPPEQLELRTGDVHLWRLNLRPEDTSVPDLERSLPLDEGRRAEGYLNLDARRRYVVARTYLRLILGHYVGQPPADLRFTYQQNGKPNLEGDFTRQIQFNLSHAHRLGLLAVSYRRVGVDIEFMAPRREMRKIANRFFSPEEVAEIMALPADLQEAACYHVWACKEALLKAWGVGLSAGINRVQIGAGCSGTPRILKHLGGEFIARRWWLSLIDPGPNYTGALAVEAQQVQLRQFHFSL